MATWRKAASAAIIKTGRRGFANTPIQRLPLTTNIYRRVFRFGNPGDEISVDFRGVKLTALTRDATIVPGLVGGFYEKIELDVFEQISKSSSTIIDVGANIGLYSCIAASHGPESRTVVAFEPVPENLRYLRLNLEQNTLPARVVVEEKAVGESAGDVRIYLAEGSIGTHSPSAKNALGSTTYISAPMVTLDEYAAEYLHCPVDVLKVDVEGYEGAVLRGASNILHRDHPTLFVEFVPRHLENCEFSPVDFLNMIFELYDHVFLVDEPRATVKGCSKDDLLDGRREHKNANLIAVSGERHPDHLRVLS
jgi:FkbM family methyltransferase